MAETQAVAVKRGARLRAAFSRERVAKALHSRFALRFHTSILLLWSFCAGLLTTKALLWFGVQSMFFRYTIAIVVAYAAFLLGVRIWLHYVGAGRHASGGSERRVDSNRSDGSLDLSGLDIPGRGSGGGSPDVFAGGGGGTGGGGASANFDGGSASSSNLFAADATGASANIGSGKGGGFGLGDLGDLGGDGDGCLIAFAIIILVALLALAVGAAFFVISMGPEILIEAAFNAILAGGLVKAGQRVSDPDWLGSVLKGTWKPFAIVLAAAWVFTALAAMLTPQAHTFGEVWRIVWPQLLQAI